MRSAAYLPLILPGVLLLVLLWTPLFRHRSLRFQSIVISWIALVSILFAQFLGLFLFYYAIYEEHIIGNSSFYTADNREWIDRSEVPTVVELYLRAVRPFDSWDHCFSSYPQVCKLATWILSDEILGGAGYSYLGYDLFFWALVSALLGLGFHWLIDHSIRPYLRRLLATRG